ncbi:MAG: phosphatidate cytidylyltransferase [Clostridia bacterium]|nr:phosphatidate cytidylyltransferase [Clostridia bacterium]
MATRIFTSAVGLVVFFLALFAGQGIFTAAICIVTVGMLFELYNAIKYKNELNITGVISAAVLLAGTIAGGVYREFSVAVFVMIYLGVMVWLHTVVTYKEIASHALLTFFVTFFFGTLIRIYADFGVYYVLMVFVCAWTTDSGAYFTGRAIGRHKLIPKVSPKKTVEGAIGGVVTSLICCWIYTFILNCVTVSDMGFITVTVVSLIASLCSQLGDLVASAIKRDCEVKDFGNLLPGHGGLLDRFDSVIYITPIIYYILLIAAK